MKSSIPAVESFKNVAKHLLADAAAIVAFVLILIVLGMH